MAKYFDEEVVKKKLLDIRKSGNWDKLEEIIPEIEKIILGVINTHNFKRFGIPVQQLREVAMYNILEALRRFDPDKGRLFAYLSLVVKNSLIIYTQKERKYQSLHVPIEPKIVGVDEENDESYYVDNSSELVDHNNYNIVNILEQEFGIAFVDDLLEEIKKTKKINKDNIYKYIEEKYGTEVKRRIEEILCDL